jgi:hypothetical protein
MLKLGAVKFATNFQFHDMRSKILFISLGPVSILNGEKDEVPPNIILRAKFPPQEDHIPLPTLAQYMHICKWQFSFIYFLTGTCLKQAV